MFFDRPEVEEFFENRIVISWNIIQPKELPLLEKIEFMISGDPELVFDPKQNSIIEIPALEDNKIILNWVASRPRKQTEIFLSISCPTIKETQKIVFNP